MDEILVLVFSFVVFEKLSHGKSGRKPTPTSHQSIFGRIKVILYKYFDVLHVLEFLLSMSLF
jgi:hypothetical protein